MYTFEVVGGFFFGKEVVGEFILGKGDGVRGWVIVGF